MKKKYEKPVLNASMEGTLEGVYAYGVFGATGLQVACTRSGNGGSRGTKVTKYYLLGWCGFYEVDACTYYSAPFWVPGFTKEIWM